MASINDVAEELKYIRGKVDDIAGRSAEDHALLHAHLAEQGNKPERAAVVVSALCLLITVSSLMGGWWMNERVTVMEKEKVYNEKHTDR